MLDVADITPKITLPASGDCYGISVVSQKRIRIPKAECDELKKKGIFLFFDDYTKLKFVTLKNCRFNECRQIEGTFDALFLALDQSIQDVQKASGVMK